jgi:hypothetical protein
MTTKQQRVAGKASPSVHTNHTPETKPTKPQYPIRLTGTITWLVKANDYFQQVKIQNAIFRSDREIAFDCDCGEAGSSFVYTAVFYRTDENLFEGQFTVGKGSDRETGTALCRLYSNSSGYTLTGIWTEDGRKDEWFAELFPKQHSA